MNSSGYSKRSKGKGKKLKKSAGAPVVPKLPSIGQKSVVTDAQGAELYFSPLKKSAVPKKPASARAVSSHSTHRMARTVHSAHASRSETIAVSARTQGILHDGRPFTSPQRPALRRGKSDVEFVEPESSGTPTEKENRESRSTHTQGSGTSTSRSTNLRIQASPPSTANVSEAPTDISRADSMTAEMRELNIAELEFGKKHKNRVIGASARRRKSLTRTGGDGPASARRPAGSIQTTYLDKYEHVQPPSFVDGEEAVRRKECLAEARARAATENAVHEERRKLERSYIRRQLEMDMERKRCAKQLHKQKIASEWSRRFRHSPFQTDLVAHSERVEEENRVQSARTSRRTRDTENRQERLLREALDRSVRQQSAEDQARQQRRLQLEEMRRMQAMHDVMKADSVWLEHKKYRDEMEARRKGLM